MLRSWLSFCAEVHTQPNAFSLHTRRKKNYFRKSCLLTRRAKFGTVYFLYFLFFVLRQRHVVTKCGHVMRAVSFGVEQEQARHEGIPPRCHRGSIRQTFFALKGSGIFLHNSFDLVDKFGGVARRVIQVS